MEDERSIREEREKLRKERRNKKGKNNRLGNYDDDDNFLDKLIDNEIDFVEELKNEL